MTYITLFFSAFISATLIPMGSEALLLYDAHLGYPLLYIWGVATIGNVLGSLLNYWMGLGGEEMLERRGLIRQGSLKRPKYYFDKYGGVMLLFAWAPVVGDMFTFAAGVLRYRFDLFLILVSISKGGRYALLLWGWEALKVGVLSYPIFLF